MFHVKHKITTHAVPRETWSRAHSSYLNSPLFEEYMDRLLWWNSKVNLISRDSTRKTINNHIKHSILPYFLNILSVSEHYLDIGTGGGMPGIPLKIACRAMPLHLNDIAAKKCLAIRDILRHLNLNDIEVHTGDFNKLNLLPYDCLISKHAFKIHDIIDGNLFKFINRIILYKGEDYKKELSELPIPLAINEYKLSDLTTFLNNKSILEITSLNE